MRVLVLFSFTVEDDDVGRLVQSARVARLDDRIAVGVVQRLVIELGLKEREREKRKSKNNEAELMHTLTMRWFRQR